MSVVTVHELTFPNAKERLLNAGVVKPGLLYSVRSDKYVEFANVLNYSACDKQFGEETIAKYKSEGYYSRNPETKEYERRDYPEKYLADCDKFPISFSEDGNTVSWFVNYGRTGDPALAIQKLFPHEVMDYVERTEGQLDMSIHIMDGQTCTKDGVIISNDTSEDDKPIQASQPKSSGDREVPSVDTNDTSPDLQYPDK